MDYYYPSLYQYHVTDSHARIQHWMLAMAQYPPPPQPDQHHYNALYPDPAGAQQLVDSQGQLQYSNLNQPVYSKVESATSDQVSGGAQMQNLTQELQHHAAIRGQQPQHIHEQAQQMQPQNPLEPPSGTSHSTQSQVQQGNPDQNQKNRLRKACDSCSIRKVKVS